MVFYLKILSKPFAVVLVQIFINLNVRENAENQALTSQKDG